MFKFFIAIIVLVSASFSAQEDSYIFEAKGKFAKDLKQLVEKYSKDGKIDVKVIKAPKGNKGNSLISALMGSENNVDLSVGKKIYDSNCFQCHGIHAQKSSYANARILSKLSKQEIIDQVYSYRRDINYGGSTRFIMYNAVDAMNETNIESVAQYIVNMNKKNVKGSIKESTSTFTDNSNNEEKSSYLK